jgi:choline-sulfatase
MLGISAIGFANANLYSKSDKNNKKSYSSKRQPNILLIMTDEHNGNVVGNAGDPYVNTPNIDKLAKNGITLENAYTNSPVCAPSRLSFLSGKYVSRVDMWHNWSWLPSNEYTTLPHLLNKQGYDSYLCGKMHFDPTRRYGFEEYYFESMYNKKFKRGIGWRRKINDLKSHEGFSKRLKNARIGNSKVLDHDRNVTKGVSNFLKTRSNQDKPFFIAAGYQAPHFPFVVPKEYYEKYKGNVPLPKIPKNYFDELPLNYKHLRKAYNIEEVPKKNIRKAREIYYGMVEWVDNQIGQVLKALDESEVKDNTVVIYTSDHGENMGEHGLWFKNCMFESAVKVPLIIRWPDRWEGGKRRKGACSLVDLSQTIAVLGKADTPLDWNGTSLVPWLDDSNYEWKNQAISQYYATKIASGFSMIRKDEYKYVYHPFPESGHQPERELYNLEKDPNEFNNLANNPDYSDIIKSLHRELIREIGEDPSSIELRCRADYASGYNREKPQN